MKKYPILEPKNLMDCGPTCIEMIAKYYNMRVSLDKIRASIAVTEYGVSMFVLRELAISLGFKTSALKVSFEELKTSRITPFVCHWNKSHYVVVYKISNKNIVIGDPGIGIVTHSENEFKNKWHVSVEDEYGYVLILVPENIF